MKRDALLKKLLQALLTVAGVLIINYFLFRVMPGDPVSMLVRNPKMSAESLANLKASLGLDKPWYLQFASYVKGLLVGDLGDSFIFKKPVLLIIGERIIPTLLLTVVAEVIAIVAGMFIGVVSA